MTNDEEGQHKVLSLKQFFRVFFRILRPERNFYWLTIIYGIGISLLSLATPISVQLLINTVANTGLVPALVMLSLTLFGLLTLFALLNALRVHLMEIFARRFYSRLVAEISLISVYAQDPFFADQSRTSLFNRYFDVILVVKAIPNLLIGGFSVLLQVAVGFVLVSLYHPLFMVFTIVISGIIWLIWLIWGGRAIRTGIELSHAKHQTADWLQTLGNSNGFFKSQRRIDFALQRTDDLSAEYITKHKKHFNPHFSQTIAFLMLYALASAGLLGLGGWLVIQGQLTLGQLVAAELVLSVAFFGVSQLGTYLTYFYDLCAAVEEVSHFLDVDQETASGSDQLPDIDATLVFKQVRAKARHEQAVFDFTIPEGATVMAAASHHGMQRLFTTLLKRHARIDGGFVTMGGVDLIDIKAQQLRQFVHVLEHSTFVGMTIREYLQLAAGEKGHQRIIWALDTVGLTQTIASFENGLDTRIASTGWPLSLIEMQMLKLANSLLAQPRVLVLSSLFDMIDEENLARSIAAVRAQHETTVIHFSNRRTDLGFDHYLYLEADRQRYFDRFEDFCLAVHGKPPHSEDQPNLLTDDAMNLVAE